MKNKGECIHDDLELINHNLPEDTLVNGQKGFLSRIYREITRLSEAFLPTARGADLPLTGSEKRGKKRDNILETL